jgi:hypothetical protein
VLARLVQLAKRQRQVGRLAAHVALARLTGQHLLQYLQRLPAGARRRGLLGQGQPIAGAGGVVLRSEDEVAAQGTDGIVKLALGFRLIGPSELAARVPPHLPAVPQMDQQASQHTGQPRSDQQAHVERVSRHTIPSTEKAALRGEARPRSAAPEVAGRSV